MTVTDDSDGRGSNPQEFKKANRISASTFSQIRR